MHRPVIGGIHAKTDVGCFSICMSGGYEDDVDHGDEILYTGSGGKDLSGNKRNGVPTFDQVLTRCNLAMTLNGVCHKDCPRCTETRACDECRARWREGMPIRVCRSAKLHSQYAPRVGLRYDGLYKLVDYWPEIGRSGFRVYRYLLRRDDPSPAPWTEEGQAFIKKHHLDELPDDGSGKPRRRQRKDKDASTTGDPAAAEPRRKKVKTEKREQGDPEGETTEEDSQVYDEWMSSAKSFMSEVKEAAPHEAKLVEQAAATLEGVRLEEQFLAALKDVLQCPICMDDMLRPTYVLPCGHHVCQVCMKRVMEENHAQCPMCRHQLPPTYLSTEATSALHASLSKHFLPFVSEGI